MRRKSVKTTTRHSRACERCRHSCWIRRESWRTRRQKSTASSRAIRCWSKSWTQQAPSCMTRALMPGRKIVRVCVTERACVCAWVCSCGSRLLRAVHRGTHTLQQLNNNTLARPSRHDMALSVLEKEVAEAQRSKKAADSQLGRLASLSIQMCQRCMHACMLCARASTHAHARVHA